MSTAQNTSRRTELALLPVLALATVLYAWAIGSLGWGNAYYSAAVKSMGQSWTNFLFGAYDPAGVVTVDKPPAALWPQVLATKILGMHGWVVLLPQVIEGVAAVWLLYVVVRRWTGRLGALVAAVVLTLTPITVAINRDNNPDTLLVLVLIAAAYALTRAVQTRVARTALVWLCLCGFLIGVGFLTKMLVAWMVLPAFAAAWLAGARLGWWPRIWRLLVAGVVALVSSLWWVLLVTVWPGDKPYIGGSTDGSAWDLVIGYNGLGRVFGEGNGPTGGGGFSFGGAAGWDRLFNDIVGGQISWLLPACGVALVVAVVVAVLRRRGVATAGVPLGAAGWLMWGGWLVVCGAVFSTQQGIFHPYYTTLLAPAAGALVGGLVAALRRAHLAGARWALPVAAATVAVTAAWAVAVISRDTWFGWLRWVVIAAAVVAVALLLTSLWRRRVLVVAAIAAAVATLAAPAVWASSVTWSESAMGGANPTAGPGGLGFPSGGRRGGGGMSLPSGMSLPGGMTLPGGGSLPDSGSLRGGGQGFPGGDVPGGTLPSGAAPGGAVPNGAVPSGAVPSGAVPGGDAPDTATGNGMPGGMSGFPGGGMSGMPGGGRGRPGGMGGLGGDKLTDQQKKILDYAIRGAGNARIVLAVEGGAQTTSAFILNSDATVIGMGGFSGQDDAPSVGQLQKWVAKGELRYVLGSARSQAGSQQQATRSIPGFDSAAPQQRATWLAANCTEVPATEYGGTDTSQPSAAVPFGGNTLYDCETGA